jgi:hypothetical protein
MRSTPRRRQIMWNYGPSPRVASHVQDVSTPLRGILPIVPPIQYGLKLTGVNRFVGRLS